MGNADQLEVGEDHARAFAAVMEQDIDAGGLELCVELFRRRLHTLGLVHIDRRDRAFEGRDGERPHDALVVMVLFDGGGDDARYADAVAAHDHGHFGAAGVQHARLHGLAVLGAELEDVADFDAALDIERAAAVGTRIAGLGVAQIGDLGLDGVAAPVHAGQMMAPLIGAADEIREHGRRSIDDHLAGQGAGAE